MKKAKKGDYVQIHNIILEAGERSENLPEETKKVPLELKVRGILIDDEAQLNDQVTIETYIGRKFEGKLIDISPTYEIDYGEVIEELLPIGKELKIMLEGSE
ncbi:MAG: 2-amino-4-oxopentanoate thiolase subunit OrtA [Bacillota bacterium]